MTGIVALALLLQGSVAPIRAPQVSVQVTPEAPAIGEVITIELRVLAPALSEVRFPALPDSLHGIEALDPRALRDASSADFVDRTAIYRMIAFDTGQATAHLGDVTIRREGAETRHAVSLAPIRIRSVLPLDSAARVPRPAQPLLELRTLYWRWWVALAVFLVLAAWIGLSWQRARRAGATPDAATRARDAFAHARALGLLEAGETGRHVLAHVDVVRDYLAARFPAASRSLTGRELTAALGAEFPILPERVALLVGRSDEVAFANASLTALEAKSLAASAVAIVDDVETAWQARLLRDADSARRIIRRRP